MIDRPVTSDNRFHGREPKRNRCFFPHRERLEWMDRCLRVNVALHLSRSVLSNCLGRSTMAMSFSSLFLYTTMSQHCWIPVSCNRSSRWQCKLSTLPHCSYFADTNSNSRIASSRVESSVVWWLLVFLWQVLLLVGVFVVQQQVEKDILQQHQHRTIICCI